MTSQLALQGDGALLVERARTLLRQAATVDEAKDIHDQIRALEVYARGRRAADEGIRYATIARYLAERRIGELTRTMPRAAPKQSGAMARGKGKGGTDTLSAPPPTKRAALAQVNLDERQALRWERLAEIPERDFGTYAEQRVDGSMAAGRKDRPAHVGRRTAQEEWYTPAEYLDAARTVLGAIDLDPASTEAANQTVKASRFYTVADDGLNKPWKGRVWLNPPYARGTVDAFAVKLLEETRVGRTRAAVVLVNNATETLWCQKLMQGAAAVCFPRGRVDYLNAQGQTVKNPLQGQALLYFGPGIGTFCATMARVGACWVKPTEIPF